MNILKSIQLYFKLFYLFLIGKIIGKEEYKEEYDEISKTYLRWIERMKKYTDEILRFELLNMKNEVNVLDFACGTGYIANRLLSNLDNPKLSLTAVDISDEMLEIAQSEIKDPRCSFVLQEGMSFLENEEKEKYDAIYCGFALPYFKRRKVVKHFNRVLKKEGTVHVILNCRGTLEGIFEIYLDLMKSNPSRINKIMEIRLNLPKSEKSLNARFVKYGFDTISLKTVNEWVMFDTPNELYDWLKQTGAIAGTGRIFEKNKIIEDSIINKIKANLAFENQYRINHKFIIAIFRKSTRG
ncbi:MAG: class I SAM-dependent methyltransferase [Candidatus Heimdallarchaeaceae archaeon]